ncbi:uncharacterized protein LOC122534588 [Frieseomelitta varia]|uniref:uncharacterized protein LOC122534588 n=1 Tax=Frieseomelitta varia TaxID=561572 RepID=UPI001CB69D6D|nr:uncharacterized protein LOC122534588 [Frieseomelitta varia]
MQWAIIFLFTWFDYSNAISLDLRNQSNGLPTDTNASPEQRMHLVTLWRLLMGVHVLVCTPRRRQKRRGGALFSYELAYEPEAGRERDLWDEVGSDPIRVSRSRSTNTFRSIDRCVRLMDH